ncbi:BTB/POZ domain-containing protein 7, partial [Trichinella patagoniensis]
LNNNMGNNFSFEFKNTDLPSSAEVSSSQQFRNAIRVRRKTKRDKKLKSKLFKESYRTFRQMLSSWCLRNLHCLMVELEASWALRELTVSADLSRPQAPSLRNSLLRMYEQATLTDVVLVFQGRRFAVHRCIVSRRSLWLRTLLRQAEKAHPTTIEFRLPPGCQIPDSPTPRVVDYFIRFLYTGYIDERDLSADEAVQLALMKISLGVSNDWHGDMFDMIRQPNEDADLIIVFTRASSSSAGGGPQVEPESAVAQQQQQSGSKSRVSLLKSQRKMPKCQYLCHSVILASRSAFFLSLISKRRADCSEQSDRITICLDESVIPRQYAPVVFEALYLDKVDLSLVSPGSSPSCSSLSEVKVIASGKCLASPLEEATEIYQIARDSIIRIGCEDLIASKVDFDSLLALYNWSSESYGSAYVRRCCVAFLAEHLTIIANSADLFELDESMLVEALKLDFVQASELEILSAVIRWGEHQVIRRLEEREPNVIAGTTHSISRKGLKRNDQFDAELMQILVRLLPLVRTDFILPRNSPVLVNAVKRNLLNISDQDDSDDADQAALSSPNDTTSSDQQPTTSRDGSACDRLWSCAGMKSRIPTQPRVFLPFYKEVRRLFIKKVAASPDQILSLINHEPSSSEMSPCTVDLLKACPTQWMSLDTSNIGEKNEVFLPDGATLETIRQTVDHLFRNDPVVRKALACGCSYHRASALDQVRIRVIRENGLDDSVLALLRMPDKFSAVYRTCLHVTTTPTNLPDVMPKCDDKNYTCTWPCERSRRSYSFQGI